ncbi:tetraacyldisaccharide 4'-kinase [Rhodobacteraceae bacterium XHP0102]|nr:tetraacyldisaccharide 4'-kinase [Rhodobacteraceae bacterium XHP0102]
MQEPKFWHRPNAGLIGQMLRPLSALYAAATARKLATGARHKMGVPVICVGNLSIGGTGKTPTVIALCEILSAAGHSPHIISRGYGGQITVTTRVDPARHSASDCGDEPLLLSAFAPVWVGRDRVASARAAVDAGADVLILDDGFQNASLAYDLSFIVVDALRGFGNGLVIPAGPLREPVAKGLARADFLLSIGDPAAQARFQQNIFLPAATCLHLQGRLEPLNTGLSLQNMPVLAFAGIGNPEKFFVTLREMGAQVLRAEALSDHQPLTDGLMARILRDARALGAQPVTTEKDAVRLPAKLRREVLTVPVRLRLSNDQALRARLTDLFSKNP